MIAGDGKYDDDHDSNIETNKHNEIQIILRWH